MRSTHLGAEEASDAAREEAAHVLAAEVHDGQGLLDGAAKCDAVVVSGYEVHGAVLHGALVEVLRAVDGVSEVRDVLRGSLDRAERRVGAVRGEAGEERADDAGMIRLHREDAGGRREGGYTCTQLL